MVTLQPYIGDLRRSNATGVVDSEVLGGSACLLYASMFIMMSALDSQNELNIFIPDWLKIVRRPVLTAP